MMSIPDKVSELSVPETRFDGQTHIHHKAVEKFSLLQTQLDIMEPNIYLVSTKLDFVTIFTDFCDAKMRVYDSFCFGPQEKRSNVFCFSSAEICFPYWVSFFMHQY